MGQFINADVIARRIRPDNPEGASIEAGRLVLEELDRLVAQRASFVYETTLSSRQSIDLMQKARAAAFEVDLAFIVLHDADLHVERVASRRV
jgi:predicted ABC-type ATPase